MAARKMITSLILVYIFLPLSATNNNEKDITKRLNQFSIKMYKEIKHSVTGNIIFSSFSMYTAFAMLGIGAKHKTMDQMSKVFDWGNFDTLLKEIKPMYDHMNKNVSKNDSLLAIANKLWVDNNITLLNTYTKELLQTFSAVADREDFTKDSDAIRQKINKWVEQKTYDKIKDLFPPNSISSTTRLALANAIYFKGKWKMPFDKINTRSDKFYLSSSSHIPVDFMKKSAMYAIYNDHGRNVDVLEIPYSGDKFSMVFVKPTNYNLGSIENTIGIAKSILDCIYLKWKPYCEL